VGLGLHGDGVRSAAVGLACLLVGGAVAWTPSASAQGTSEVGDANDALPGLIETRVAATRPAHLSLAVAGGYGYTEALASDDGAHHRAQGSLSVAGFLLPQLALGVRLNGRYDVHPDDGYGPDDGGVISSELSVRGVGHLADRFDLGGQVTARLVGAEDVSQALDALSFDLTALGAYRATDTITLAFEAGYRVDRSGAAFDPNVEVRRGDYIAWGVSDYDAILLRGGVDYHKGAIEVIGEVASRVLVGSGAPTDLSSVHVNGAFRYHIDRRFQLSASAQVEVGRRPDVGLDPTPTMPFVPQDALVVIDPRFVVQLGFRYRWERVEGAAAQEEASEAPEPEPEARPVVPAPVATRTVEGHVVDDAGEPLADVTVEIHVGDTVVEQRTGIDGGYLFEGVPSGPGTVHVRTEGFAEREVPLTEQGLPDPIRLDRGRAGGQLRGLIRRFNGEGVRGTVTIQPGGLRVVADENGRFEVDLPPGDYTVRIRAYGLRSQNQDLTIRDGEVTILNADLHPR